MMRKDIVVTEIILCHQFTAPPGWLYKEYSVSRRWCGLVYVQQGQAIFQMNQEHGQKILHVRAGNVLYFTPDTSYTICGCDEEPFGHITVNFQLSDTDSLSMLPVCMMPLNDQKVRQIFLKLAKEWSSRHTYYQVSGMRILYDLICTLLSENEHVHESYRQKLQPSIMYLEEHYCSSFSEDKLSDLCKMSKTYFRRLFKKVYKETPVQYRSRLRIGRACDLLLSGFYSVEQVSELCGYDDPAYFSRIFKKSTGLSPSKYKTEGYLNSDS